LWLAAVPVPARTDRDLIGALPRRFIQGLRRRDRVVAGRPCGACIFMP
jgi:hypothetical protein